MAVSKSVNVLSIAFIDENNKMSSGDGERNKQAVEQRKIEHISRRHTLQEPTLQDIAPNKSLTAAIFQFSAPLSHSGNICSTFTKSKFSPTYFPFLFTNNGHPHTCRSVHSLSTNHIQIVKI